MRLFHGMLSIQNTFTYLKLPRKYTFNLLNVNLKSEKLEQIILNLIHFNCVEIVQLKIHWSIFDCAKVELLQVYFRYTLNILHLNTKLIKDQYIIYYSIYINILFKDHAILINSDIKTHFRPNVKRK